MRIIIFIGLFLSIVGCKNNSEITVPSAFPFGYNLNEFTNDRTNEYGGGDCWGFIRQFSNKDIQIVTDSSSCGEYGFENRFYLIDGGSIVKAHTQEGIFEFDENAQKPRYVITENIYDLMANPATLFTRTDSLDRPDIKLLTKAFEKEEIKNTTEMSDELKSQMEEAWALKNEMPEESDFYVFSEELEEDEETGISQHQIYLGTPLFEEPLLLVTENGFQQMPDKASWELHGIPSNAIFAFNTWYAGGGYFYYGVLDNTKLQIFRKFVDEGIPEREEQPFELFKTIDTENAGIAGERTGTSHYICYKSDGKISPDLMIAFMTDGKAVYAKYRGQSATLDLEFEKEVYEEGGAHPNIIQYYKEIVGGKTNGYYKLTHSGIWDYVEYKRGKDGKVFNFTIDHDTVGDGYPDAPCF